MPNPMPLHRLVTPTTDSGTRDRDVGAGLGVNTGAPMTVRVS